MFELEDIKELNFGEKLTGQKEKRAKALDLTPYLGIKGLFLKTKNTKKIRYPCPYKFNIILNGVTFEAIYSSDFELNNIIWLTERNYTIFVDIANYLVKKSLLQC